MTSFGQMRTLKMRTTQTKFSHRLNSIDFKLHVAADWLFFLLVISTRKSAEESPCMLYSLADFPRVTLTGTKPRSKRRDWVTLLASWNVNLLKHPNRQVWLKTVRALQRLFFYSELTSCQNISPKNQPLVQTHAFCAEIHDTHSTHPVFLWLLHSLHS